jgi:N-6 DNA Methylase
MAVELLAAPALLMSMTEIAELAKVRRPVVTTWRRRHRDFPAPAGGDAAQPLFHPRQVADWLIGTGRADRDQVEPELSLYTLTGLVGQYPGTDLVAAVTALICLRYLADENEPLADGTDQVLAVLREQASVIDPNDLLLLAEVAAIPPAAGWLPALVDELIEAAWGCRQAFERIMTARNRFRAGTLSASAVSPALARLIAELSGARELGRRTDSLIVTDPAAGAGDLLAAVAHVLGPDCAPMFTGAEADQGLARLVRRRLAVYGIPPADMDIHIGTELPDESGDPDVIVTQIPYRPGEERDAVDVLNSVDDVAMRMTSGRFAVVFGPAAALADDLPPFSAAARARADLLKGDMVEAIVRLPGGLVPFRPGYETALWVLTQARHSRWRGRVLLADVSDRPLTADVGRDLAEDIITWRRDGYLPQAHRRAFGVQVEISGLVDPPRPLMTGRRPASQRERKTDADERVTLVTQCGADLDRLGATATADRGHIPTEAMAAADRPPVTEATGALVRQGRLVVRKGIRLAPADAGGSGKHVVLGAEEVLGFRRPGERRVDLEVFAQRYPNARLTEPGDVLVITTPRPGAMIDHDGYSIAEYPVRILRIPRTETEQFTPRVLASLLFADGSGRRPAGAVRAADNLKEQRIPLFPVAEVRHLDALLASIDARRALAQREIDMLDELCHIVTGGLIDGTLTLISDDK